MNDILDFCNDQEYSILISIYGESGCGKTLFARALIDKLLDQPNLKARWANNERTLLLASTINSSTEKNFLNIWIPILRAMLDILKTRRNMKKEIILANMFKNNEDIADSKFRI
jgi:ABC-type dipeptide/oligopeptide/nickel transport system ATPase component